MAACHDVEPGVVGEGVGDRGVDLLDDRAGDEAGLQREALGEVDQQILSGLRNVDLRQLVVLCAHSTH